MDVLDGWAKIAGLFVFVVKSAYQALGRIMYIFMLTVYGIIFLKPAVDSSTNTTQYN